MSVCVFYGKLSFQRSSFCAENIVGVYTEKEKNTKSVKNVLKVRAAVRTEC